ncbi:MAG: hypothetical protein HYZ53_06875 [Planctomycetes bacterium]|nr:hypothetical protein [Planctomycetota bacterium]
MSAEIIEAWFPGLRVAGYRVTSPVDPAYNCVAWAADEVDRRWWPDDMGVYFWPAGVPRKATLDTFREAFAVRGFLPTADGTVETGIEKLAILADGWGRPTHVARQLASGGWTSKLGIHEDIEHGTLEPLQTDFYGTVRLYLARPRPA